jgi:N-hydroxyarylamine O-acetyltransferase
MARRRGGYCYELNALFAALLRAQGYEVELLSARVGRPDGTLSPEFDHMALRVRSPRLLVPHLADVGFGDAFLRPLPLEPGTTRREGSKRLRLDIRAVDQSGPGPAVWIYDEDRGAGFSREHGYAFTLAPHALEEFEPRNVFQQTSPESHFTRGRLCTLATPTGRLTLSGHRLITTADGLKTETLLEEGQVVAVLRERFGVILGGVGAARSAPTKRSRPPP